MAFGGQCPHLAALLLMFYRKCIVTRKTEPKSKEQHVCSSLNQNLNALITRRKQPQEKINRTAALGKSKPLLSRSLTELLLLLSPRQRQVGGGAVAGLAALCALPGAAGRVLRQRPAQQPLAGSEGPAGGPQGPLLLLAPAGGQGESGEPSSPF